MPAQGFSSLIDLTAGEFRTRLDYLRKDQLRVLGVTMKMFFQQHMRPIVRGKASAKVMFGAKIGVNIVEGYNFMNHHNWDAYNESCHLQIHINKYKEHFGCLSETIYTDKIYMKPC